MKLKDYIHELMMIEESCIGAREFEVVYARDDECNRFNPVHFEPIVGAFDGESFVSKSMMEESSNYLDFNCVCIN